MTLRLIREPSSHRNDEARLQLLRLVCLNTAGEARAARDACAAVGR